MLSVLSDGELSRKKERLLSTGLSEILGEDTGDTMDSSIFRCM